MSEQQGSGDISFVLGLIAGAAIGLVVGVILTPKSGQETREVIREQGLVLRDRVQDTADTVRQKAASTAASAQANAEQTRDTVINSIQAPDSSNASA